MLQPSPQFGPALRAFFPRRSWNVSMRHTHFGRFPQPNQQRTDYHQSPTLLCDVVWVVWCVIPDAIFSPYCGCFQMLMAFLEASAGLWGCSAPFSSALPRLLVMRMAVLFFRTHGSQDVVSACLQKPWRAPSDGPNLSQRFAKAQEKELKKMQERQMRPTGAQTRVSTQRLPSPTGKINIRYSIRV